MYVEKELNGGLSAVLLLVLSKRIQSAAAQGAAA